MRKEKVTPKGTPASTKPMNKGTAEHEQNGVTIPSMLASTLPNNNDFFSSTFLVCSGEKNVRIIPTANTIKVRSKRTLGTSYKKNLIASVRRVKCSSPNIESIKKLTQCSRLK